MVIYDAKKPSYLMLMLSIFVHRVFLKFFTTILKTIISNRRLKLFKWCFMCIVKNEFFCIVRAGNDDWSGTEATLLDLNEELIKKNKSYSYKDAAWWTAPRLVIFYTSFFFLGSWMYFCPFYVHMLVFVHTTLVSNC